MKKPSFKVKTVRTVWNFQFLALLCFQGVVSFRIKPNKFFFLVFLVEFQFYSTGFLRVYVTVPLLKKYLTSKIEKNVPHVFFCLFVCFFFVFFCFVLFLFFAILWTPWSWKENFHNLNLSFWTFKGTLKILQITFCRQIQQEKSLKWP